MFDHTHYVPILKWKQGEYWALETLVTEIRARVFPVLEVVPVAMEDEEGGIPSTPDPARVEEHLRKLPAQLKKAWPGAPGFLDLLHLQPDARLPGDVHPVEHLFRGTREQGLAMIPVCGPERDAAHRAAVARVVATDKRGVCVRLTPDELFDAQVPTSVPKLLRELGVKPQQADLLMDVGELPLNTALLSLTLPNLLAGLSSLGNWRTFTLAAGSFPDTLSEISGFGTLPRVEWHLWNQIVSGLPAAARVPTFGDYAIQHPAPQTGEALNFAGSANIRYVGENEWYIFRGRKLTTYGWDQYHELSRSVVRHSCYSGTSFSWGDRHINQCANRGVGPGNGSVWRKVGTAHHITYVVRQVANQYGISI